MPKFLVPLCSAALLSLMPVAGRAAPDAPPATATPSTSPAPSAPPAPASASSTLSTSAAPSSASPRLTLSAAIDRALTAHPRLRAAAFELEAAEGAVQQAALPPNPTLGLEQEDTRRETRTVTVLLSQPLEIGGQRAARTALARRGRDLSQAELDALRAELRADVVQAFFAALVAQERVVAADESVRIAGGGADATARRVSAGKLAPNDETRARVAEATARIERRQAQADQLAARHALAAAVGMDQAAIGALDGAAASLPTLPGEAEVARRLADAPALRRARLEVERAQAAYELERARRIPDVTVTLGAKRAQEIGRNQAVIGLSMPLPLFDRNQGAQREALKRRQAAEQLAEAESLRLRAEVLSAADELAARTDEVDALQRTVLPGAREAYTAATRGFELGKFGFLDVLDAQRTWLQARMQWLDALARAHRANADLERRLGAPVQQP
ncbi:TolC family protein [Roseateles chitinivorans]|uniref:TolC family protein n=1 Tax=Roseateles chitinivorans TaxID=2917965 RepID=UPI003D6662B7